MRKHVILQELAIAYAYNDDVSKAKEVIAELLDYVEKNYGKKTRSYAVALNRAAMALLEADPEQAQEYNRQCGAIQTLAGTLTNLRSLYSESHLLEGNDLKDKLDQAFDLYETIEENLTDLERTGIFLFDAEVSIRLSDLSRTEKMLERANRLIQKNLATIPRDDYQRKPWEDLQKQYDILSQHVRDTSEMEAKKAEDSFEMVADIQTLSIAALLCG